MPFSTQICTRSWPATALSWSPSITRRAGPPSYRATLKQAKHESFSDQPLLLASGDANGTDLMRLARAITLEFFDTTLKDFGRKVIAAHSDSDLDLEIFAPP